MRSPKFNVPRPSLRIVSIAVALFLQQIGDRLEAGVIQDGLRTKFVPRAFICLRSKFSAASVGAV